MKSYKLELTHQAGHALEKMARREPAIYRRMANALDALKEDPFQGKALKGKLRGKYSFRVGSYRIIYTVHNQILTVFVIDIGHRREIYRQ